KMRAALEAQGCKIRFDSKVAEILLRGKNVSGVRLHDGEKIECEHLILACGHSSEDMFKHLHELDVAMEPKSYAIGLRVEHPQSYINEIQYREYKDHPKLGAANYKLAYHNKSEDIGVYSFCMCPGGYVLSCTTDGLGTVSNGMSNFKRNSKFANAAIVVTI